MSSTALQDMPWSFRNPGFQFEFDFDLLRLQKHRRALKEPAACCPVGSASSSIFV